MSVSVEERPEYLDAPFSNGPTELPPGPRLPATLQTLNVIARPIPWIEQCRDRYGPVYTLKDKMLGTMIYIGDPDVIQGIFKADPSHFAGGGEPRLEALFGDSMLMLGGADHLHRRRFLTPAFHGESIKRYTELMAEVAEREIARWPLNKPFSLYPSTSLITMDVILRTLFGEREPEKRDELRDLIFQIVRLRLVIFDWARRDFPASPWRKFLRLRAAIDSLIYAEIGRRRSQIEPSEQPDLLSMLMSARDEDGDGLSDRELRDELVTFLVVGHETTATALAWTFERLLRHPEMVRRLKEELGAGEESYLNAVVHESLRIRPPVMNAPRQLETDLEVEGYRFPAGMLLLLSPPLLQLWSRVYPNPKEFQPERFLDRSPEPRKWIPFGGGVRRCIGASFAVTEMRVVTATILRHAELRPASRRSEQIAFRGVVLKPSRGGRVVMERRLQHS